MGLLSLLLTVKLRKLRLYRVNLDEAKKGKEVTETTSEDVYSVTSSPYAPYMTDEFVKVIKDYSKGLATDKDVYSTLTSQTTHNGVTAKNLIEYNKAQAVGGIGTKTGLGLSVTNKRRKTR